MECKFFGPFKVWECIYEAAYRLQLPSSTWIHDAFHIVVLKKFVPGTTPVAESFTLELVVVDDPQFEVGSNDGIIPIPYKRLKRVSAKWVDYVLT